MGASVMTGAKLEAQELRPVLNRLRFSPVSGAGGQQKNTKSLMDLFRLSLIGGFRKRMKNPLK
jgi:hypothetical protein